MLRKTSNTQTQVRDMPERLPEQLDTSCGKRREERLHLFAYRHAIVDTEHSVSWYSERSYCGSVREILRGVRNMFICITHENHSNTHSNTGTRQGRMRVAILENGAARKIQSWYRSFLERRYLKTQIEWRRKEAAINIQRVVRGMLTRRYTQAYREVCLRAVRSGSLRISYITKKITPTSTPKHRYSRFKACSEFVRLDWCSSIS